MKTKNLIGKKYQPKDNSYSVNLTDQGDENGALKCDYIAGQLGEPGMVVTIIVNPFNLNISWDGRPAKELPFVIVLDDFGKNHLIMYYENRVI